MIRIVLVDSHRLFRVSLKSLLASFAECQVFLDVSAVDDIPLRFDASEVDLVIFDPGQGERESLERVKKLFPLAHLLILTSDSDRNNVRDYMGLGISGFFSKEDCPLQLEKAIREISGKPEFNEVRLGAVIRQELISEVEQCQTKKVQFSDREIQILKLVCMEKTNTEISAILGVSVRTVESHRRRMIDKVDCKSIIGVILNVLELTPVNLKKSDNRYLVSGRK